MKSIEIEQAQFEAIRKSATPDELHQACWNWKFRHPAQDWVCLLLAGDEDPKGAEVVWNRLHDSQTGELLDNRLALYTSPEVTSKAGSLCKTRKVVQATGGVARPLSYSEGIWKAGVSQDAHLVVRDTFGVVCGVEGLGYIKGLALHRMEKEEVPGFPKLGGAKVKQKES